MAVNSERFSSTISRSIISDAHFAERTIDIIPIEIYYSEQTIRALEKIKASSLLVLLPNHAVSSARFIVEQLHKWMKCREANISWMAVNKVADFKHLLNDSQYDRILVSPGARSKVPVELQQEFTHSSIANGIGSGGSGNCQNPRRRNRIAGTEDGSGLFDTGDPS